MWLLVNALYTVSISPFGTGQAGFSYRRTELTEAHFKQHQLTGNTKIKPLKQLKVTFDTQTALHGLENTSAC